MTIHQRIIEAVTAKPATSAWHEPVIAISGVTGWPTDRARAYLETLRNRGFILPFSIVVHREEQCMFHWAKPAADYFCDKTRPR